MELEVSNEALAVARSKFLGQFDVVSEVMEKIGMINKSDIIIV